MLSERERRLARLAVENGYLTGNQLSDCFTLLRVASGGLEDLLAGSGYLTPEEISELRDQVDRLPPPAPLFAEIVRQRGFATDEQVEEALRFKDELATRNVHRYVGEILVERQVLSTLQVSQVLALQGKVSLQCQACGYRFNAQHGNGYVCPECGRPIGATPPPLSREGYIGAYFLKDELGRGPIGAVFRAIHERTQREVALKRIPAAPFSRAVRDGFLFQARRTMSLRHPNVAGILESAVHGDDIVIVSDLVEGVPLHDHVLGNVRLPLEDAIAILKQVAAGLSGALSRGIVHGDLKSHNVLVTETREVRLTDFGMGHGESGEMIHYAAPERARHGATPPGDLYACGVLWYFMLAGAPPHAGASPDEIRAARASVAATPLSRLVPSLPPGADAVFTKLTWKEPTLRYRTPAALLSDLDLLESGQLTNAERELGKR
jgi:predicted Zn-ribbon and HTH transcriptional regulator